MLTKQQKENLVKKYGRHEKDTGSSFIQIALLSAQIEELTGHLKKHRKDFHSRRGLLGMVAERRSLLAYLERKHPEQYKEVLKKLKLKK